MLNRLQTLQDQGIQNNQQIMAIILEMDEKEASKQNGVYDKLQEAKNDASKLLQKEDSYMDVSFFYSYHFCFNRISRRIHLWGITQITRASQK